MFADEFSVATTCPIGSVSSSTFGVGSGAHVLVNGVLDQAREAAERVQRS